MADLLAYLKAEKGGGLDVVGKEYDYLLSKDATPTGLKNETYLFSFQIPERDLVGYIYLWIHAELRMATSCVMIWQGVNRYPHEVEHFNVYQYLPYPDVDGDTITIPEIDLKIRIVEPLVAHELLYEHAPTNTSFRLNTRALFPPVQESGKLHFEQPLHITGDLVLNGESLKVDCYSMRDRSYRGVRSEAMTLHPPLSYASCISDDGSIVFNFSCSDDPESGPPWAEHYNFSNEELFMQGWIYRDNQMSKIRRIRKVGEYDEADFLREFAWQCEMEDEHGRVHKITAQRRAAVPMCPWVSLFNDFMLVSFEMDDGKKGYGWYNHAFWNDYGRIIKKKISS